MQIGNRSLGILQTTKHLYQEIGVLSFWRGSPIMAAACIPSHACYFTTYEASKLYWEDGVRAKLSLLIPSA